jgi:hypothetical protein
MKREESIREIESTREIEETKRIVVEDKDNKIRSQSNSRVCN